MFHLGLPPVLYYIVSYYILANCTISSSCAIPETGFGSSPHIPVLSVCFSCFYTGIWDLFFNAGSERLLERWLGNYTLGRLPLISKRSRLKHRTAETTYRTGVLRHTIFFLYIFNKKYLLATVYVQIFKY